MWTEIETALARVSSAVNRIAAVVATIEALAHWQTSAETPQAKPVVAGALAEQAQTQTATSEHVANAHAALASAQADLLDAHTDLITAVQTTQQAQAEPPDDINQTAEEQQAIADRQDV